MNIFELQYVISTFSCLKKIRGKSLLLPLLCYEPKTGFIHVFVQVLQSDLYYKSILVNIKL